MENLKEKDTELKSPRYGASVMYISIVSVVFACLTCVFICFPRSTYSELEKRDLAEFPDFSEYTDKPGKYTAAVSSWFSDTEPYRDHFMTLSMGIRDVMGADFIPEEDAVSFIPSATQVPSDATGTSLAKIDSEVTTKVDNSVSDAPYPDEGTAKIGNSGIIIVGKGNNVRALMAFGGSPSGGGGYVSLLNELAETFPSVHIYAMIAPLATEYYLPTKAAKASSPQKPFIYSVRDRLSPKVKFVDVYDELSKHTDENIYLRTDHHWAGLGGYYAAKRLAATAGVPFRGLDAYDKHVIGNFVGSMYGYSKDMSVKKAPEDFVYYTPNQVKYDAEFVTYTLNKGYSIIKESKPYRASFFKSFKDGSTNAYLTFIGSDQSYVKVKTSTPGNRRVLIIKDSYGNAVPGNLFYSFNEVHVIDFRYFSHNLKDYIINNGITDVAVCFNVFNAYSSGSSSKVKKMLTQKGGIHISELPKPAKAETASSSAQKTDKSKSSIQKKDQSKSEITSEPAVEEQSTQSSPAESSEFSESSESSAPSESSESSEPS